MSIGLKYFHWCYCCFRNSTISPFDFRQPFLPVVALAFFSNSSGDLLVLSTDLLDGNFRSINQVKFFSALPFFGVSSIMRLLLSFPVQLAITSHWGSRCSSNFVGVYGIHRCLFLSRVLFISAYNMAKNRSTYRFLKKIPNVTGYYRMIYSNI